VEVGAVGPASVGGRRSSATEGRDGGLAPWHGDSGGPAGSVAAVRPDGGVRGGDRRLLRSRGNPVVDEEDESWRLSALPCRAISIIFASLESLAGGDGARFSTRRLSSISRSSCKNT